MNETWIRESGLIGCGNHQSKGIGAWCEWMGEVSWKRPTRASSLIGANFDLFPITVSDFAACSCAWVSMVFPSHIFGAALDQLLDLTARAAQAVVTPKGRDNFTSTYMYDRSVKNMSPHPLEAESLVIILDNITKSRR
ncbi:MAG: hypothetical protein EHM80_01530 [Nitrospiraceae bacterium]|nr:MAG: hypothetical protein EHM80_01530 [Nitrospiraceae bacterium]